MNQSRIRDVAKRAGVSTATVSHTLNGTRIVSERTRNRVLAAARELGYYPSAVARSLKTKSTGSIGIIVSDITNPFSTTLVRGIEDIANENAHNVILCNSDENEAKAEAYLKLLLSKRVDGLIFAPPGTSCRSLDAFVAMGIPVVLVDRRPEGYSLPFVGVDNVLAARTAVDHLLEDGHHRIGVVAGLEEVSTSRERLKGYEEALHARGIEVDPRFVKKGFSTIEGGASATRELLTLSNPPTALFTTNNFMTLGALKTFRELDIKCPSQVAIFGFDDHEWAVIFSPPVSVVSQPAYKIGTIATQMLLCAIQGSRPDQDSVMLETKLIVRESCSPLGHCKAPGNK